MVPALVILGEAAFWGGGALLGAEIVARYRRWLNPRHWFPRDHLREKPDGTNLVKQLDLPVRGASLPLELNHGPVRWMAEKLRLPLQGGWVRFFCHRSKQSIAEDTSTFELRLTIKTSLGDDIAKLYGAWIPDR